MSEIGKYYLDYFLTIFLQIAEKFKVNILKVEV